MLSTTFAWLGFGVIVPLLIVKQKLFHKLTFDHKEASQKDGSTKRSILIRNKDLATTPHESIKTLFDVLLHGSKVFPASKLLFGSRETDQIITEQKEVVEKVHGVESVKTKTWKYAQKSAYKWLTYRDALKLATELGSGLKKLGLAKGDKVSLFASTSKEWMIMAYASYSQSLCITTAYDNLGLDALVYSLNESESKVLFCQADLFHILSGLNHKVPSLQAVVYSGKANTEEIRELQAKTGLGFYSMDELQTLGKENPVGYDLPVGDDLCCIMYTSGSTGNPKGVMLTHTNMVSSIAGAEICYGSLFRGSDEVYLGYLPLAHVLEFMVENYCVYKGIRIGYGSPRTLTDASVRNCKGDIAELRPTLMAGVPAVWEAIRKGIMAKLEQASATQRYIFNLAFELKKLLVRYGLPSGFIDKTIFAKIAASTGGRLKVAVSGGAPVASETQEFLTCVLCPVIQGYGMTECCGMMCAQGITEIGITGSVGAPSSACEIKLVGCNNYNPNPTDGSLPAGEIWVRGNNIMKGYYRQPQLTAEAVTEDGWLQTGDIAQWSENGTLKIVDRKKNLVKLSHGEYVALEKLEAEYKTSKYVLNMCIHADPLESIIIALIVPDINLINSFQKLHGIAEDDLNNPKILNLIGLDMLDIAQRAGYKSAEVLKTFALVPDEWTPENGFLTAAQKIKRKEILIQYKDQVDRMYGRK